MKARRFYALALSANVAFFVMSASANGRFPRAQHLIEEPGNPERLTLAATYGLLLTEDRGKNWSYVCDAAFAFQTPFASDAVLGISTDGRLLLGVQNAVTMSRDRGCDFTKAFEAGSSIEDFTVFSDPKYVFAVSTTFESGANVIHMHESADGGETWQRIGSPLPAALVYTIDVDPRNRDHFYATGSTLSSDASAPELFLTSNDHAATWTVATIPHTNIDSSPWIAAIHPNDGKKIFVRTDSWKKDAGGQALAGDALLYSDDGGKTWTELLRPSGSDPELPGAKLLGFALSPDGSTVLAGYGDIVDPVRVVDPEGKWMGLYKSSSDGRYSFGPGAPAAAAPVMKMPVTCLTWTREGAYGCFAPPGQSHYVAFSPDASFAPATTTTLMKANEVRGAPRCCNGRAVTACTWSTDCQALGACDGGAPTGGGTCQDGGDREPPGDAAADASTGGAAGGATGGAGGGAGNGGSAASGGRGNGDADGCGCRLSADGAAQGPAGVTSLLATLAIAARRGRARRRAPS